MKFDSVRFSFKGDQRGVALLMTLAFLALAVSIVLELNLRARDALGLAAAYRDRFQMTQVAAAGVHAAMAVLAQDGSSTPTDHPKEAWALEETWAEVVEALSLEGIHLEVGIEDEMAKIQINALVTFPGGHDFRPKQQRILHNFIRRLQFASDNEGNATEVDIVNACKDWLDSGDDEAISGLNGAESDYYSMETPPIECRNGPMPDLHELLIIRGVTKGLFYGDATHAGLEKCLTVHGAIKGKDGGFFFPGRININTASENVIAALLPPESQELAAAIVDYRDIVPPEILESTDWYRDTPGCGELVIDPNLITVKSNFFRIKSRVTSGSLQIITTAVVERLKDGESGRSICRILSWKNDLQSVESKTNF